MSSIPLEMRPATELSAFLLELPDKPDKEHDVAALAHRQELINLWGILPGSTVLEIGPGQGDFTVALADALGPKGRVVAVDPAPLDQGKPMIALPITQIILNLLEDQQARRLSALHAHTSSHLRSDLASNLSRQTLSSTSILLQRLASPLTM